MAKKRRTAAQIRATKKLVTMNKKRAKARVNRARPKRKATARRNATARLYAVFERTSDSWRKSDEVMAPSAAAAIRKARAEDRRRGNEAPSWTKYKASPVSKANRAKCNPPKERRVKAPRNGWKKMAGVQVRIRRVGGKQVVEVKR